MRSASIVISLVLSITHSTIAADREVWRGERGWARITNLRTPFPANSLPPSAVQPLRDAGIPRALWGIDTATGKPRPLNPAEANARALPRRYREWDATTQVWVALSPAASNAVDLAAWQAAQERKRELVGAIARENRFWRALKRLSGYVEQAQLAAPLVALADYKFASRAQHDVLQLRVEALYGANPTNQTLVGLCSSAWIARDVVEQNVGPVWQSVHHEILPATP